MTISAKPGRARARNAPAGTATVVTAATAALVLLAACAGSQQAQTPDEDRALAASIKSARKAVDTRPARLQRLSAQAIMREWGTRLAVRSELAQPVVPDPYLPLDDILGSELCTGCESRPYHRMVLAASRQHGVPASLIHAVIHKESSYNPEATSPRQARGLMQITPATGRFLGVHKQQRLYDPHTNIQAGTAYLKYLMGQHSTMEEVLAAYNAGSGNVRKYNGVPPFAETRQYVRDIKRFLANIAFDPGDGPDTVK